MEEKQKRHEDKNKNTLEELKKKCEEYLDGWKRERADFLNYKKEEMERIGQLVKYANEELILKILPILDNICLAARQNFSSENLGGQESTRVKSFLDGLAQIEKQFEDFLAKEGIEAIEVMSKPFDPNSMESVGEIDCSRPDLEQGEPGTVIEEVQRGYTLHGKVIRPAKVKISK